MTHPLSTGTAPADASSSHHTTSLEAQRTGGTSNADAQGIVTPPVPMVSLLHKAQGLPEPRLAECSGSIPESPYQELI